MQLVGERQAEQVGHGGAVEGREQRHRHIGAELGRIGHVGEHLHHADQRADHAECRRAVADRTIDFLPLIQVGEKIVAIALQIVTDEFGVVAVGDEADALGQERITDLDLLQPDRPLLARDLGQSGDLIDELTLAHAAQRKGKFRAERQAVEDGGQGKADEGCGKRPAEDHDEGMDVQEHAEIAAHQDETDDDEGSGNKTEACCDIHGRTPNLNATAPSHPAPVPTLARRA